MTYVIALPCVDRFYRINVEFFDELGSPGSGYGVGKIGRDHPAVAALPPQR